mgnify:CR=1 FL=1
MEKNCSVCTRSGALFGCQLEFTWWHSLKARPSTNLCLWQSPLCLNQNHTTWTLWANKVRGSVSRAFPMLIFTSNHRSIELVNHVGIKLWSFSLRRLPIIDYRVRGLWIFVGVDSCWRTEGRKIRLRVALVTTGRGGESTPKTWSMDSTRSSLVQKDSRALSWACKRARFRECLLQALENWNRPRGSSMPSCWCSYCWARKLCTKHFAVLGRSSQNCSFR